MQQSQAKPNSTVPPVSLFAIIVILTMCLGAMPLSAQDQPADTATAPVVDTLEAEKPAPATNVHSKDTPNDAGGSITVEWDLSSDDVAARDIVNAYLVMRAVVADGSPGRYSMVGDATPGQARFIDGNTSDDASYFYKVTAINRLERQDGTVDTLYAESEPAGPVSSSAQWFHFGRINVFFGVILLSFFIIYYISQARAGKELFIRKIAGLEAVDEAVGRATEMGKKIFYVPGTQDMNNVQTIAGVTILGRVAELAAQYETWLEVPVSRSLVMVTAKEIVKEAYSKVGRPDAFNEDQVHYLTDDQFGYAAGIDGMVVREKPATIFYMGAFYAESLILAETGNSIGAIQIAGTAMPAQLPFFVAACDYTLIGEELFAASAYLSKEPKLLGSLKGQDIGKGVILIAIIIGVILETFDIWELSELFRVIED